MAVSYGPVFATALDATGGVLALEVPQPGVAYAPVVDLIESPDLLADALDLPWTRSLRHGFCWGLLVPDGSRLLVVVMGREGPDLDGAGVVAGRLSEEDSRRWGPLWQGRAVRVSVLIEATPGLFGLEVRFLTKVVEERTPTVVDTGSPLVDTGSPDQDLAAPLDDAVEPLLPADTEPSIVAVTDTPPDAVPEPDAASPEPAVDDGAAQPASLAAGLLVAHAGDEPDVEPDVEDVEDEPDVDDVEPVEDVEVEVLDVAPAEEPPPAEQMAPAVDLAALMPPGAPAAWYVDPYDASSMRWWDGSRWTTDAAPRPAPEGEAGPA